MNLPKKATKNHKKKKHSDRHFFRFLKFPLQNLLPPFFVFHRCYGASPPFRNSNSAPRYDDGEATDQSSNLNKLGPQKLRIKMGPQNHAVSKKIPTDPWNIPQTLNHLFMKEILSYWYFRVPRVCSRGLLEFS